jgi:O-antigen/teichoic acid export membrane protein
MRVLYTVLACAGLLLLVPLFVLGATGGDWRHAWHALKEYLIALGIICAIGLAFAIPGILGSVFNL